jgi:hypothetical protein
LVTTSVEGAVSVPQRYPEEFRRKVLDLVAYGRPVAQIAADLDWRGRGSSAATSAT